MNNREERGGISGLVVMWCSMDIVHVGEFDDDDDNDCRGEDDDDDDDVITIRQGPVVHVIKPAVVLGAGGGAQVQVGPGQDDDEDDGDIYVDQISI